MAAPGVPPRLKRSPNVPPHFEPAGDDREAHQDHRHPAPARPRGATSRLFAFATVTGLSWGQVHGISSLVA